MVEADPDFELSAPVPFSLVCFRYHAGDDAFNMRLLGEINASGQAFLSQTNLNGRFVLRSAIGNFQTTEQDVHSRDLGFDPCNGGPSGCRAHSRSERRLSGGPADNETFAGIILKNPVIAASGTFGYGLSWPALFRTSIN